MKPSDFLIGIRDLFIFLVPGSVFLFLVEADRPLQDSLGGEGVGLFAFAILAYGIGSVASHAGASLDWAVDRAGERIASARIDSQAAQTRELAEAFQQAVLAQLTGIEGITGHSPAKGFWWHMIRLHSPVAIAELDRLESIQKLFRALVLVFIFHSVFVVNLPASGALELDFSDGGDAALLGAAAFASLWLYVANRRKFTLTVYRFAAALSITDEMIDSARGPFGKRVPEILGKHFQ